MVTTAEYMLSIFDCSRSNYLLLLVPLLPDDSSLGLFLSFLSRSFSLLSFSVSSFSVSKSSCSFHYFFFPFQRVLGLSSILSLMFSFSVFKRFISISKVSFSFSADHSCWVDLCRSFCKVNTLSLKTAFSS